MSLPIKDMLSDAATVEKWIAEGVNVMQSPAVEVVGNLCCHVRALAEELELSFSIIERAIQRSEEWKAKYEKWKGGLVT